jgi:hypothetical protein
LFLAVVGLLLGIAACTAGPPDRVDENVSAVAVSGGGVSVDVLPTVSWPNSFLGAVRITNVGFESLITTFEVVFKLGGSAGAGIAFNGNVTAADTSGNRTATNPAWLSF